MEHLLRCDYYVICSLLALYELRFPRIVSNLLVAKCLMLISINYLWFYSVIMKDEYFDIYISTQFRGI